VNRPHHPWMRIMGYTKLESVSRSTCRPASLKKITTLVFLGGKDGLVGDVAPAERRAQRYIAGCEIEVLPNAGRVMSVEKPEFVGRRIVEFLQESPTPGSNPLGKQGLSALAIRIV